MPPTMAFRTNSYPAVWAMGGMGDPLRSHGDQSDAFWGGSQDEGANSTTITRHGARVTNPGDPMLLGWNIPDDLIHQVGTTEVDVVQFSAGETLLYERENIHQPVPCYQIMGWHSHLDSREWINNDQTNGGHLLWSGQMQSPTSFRISSTAGSSGAHIHYTADARFW